MLRPAAKGARQARENSKRDLNEQEKREETINRISRELASTTAEVMSITATTTPEIRANILTRAAAKLSQFVFELRTLDGVSGGVVLKFGDRGTSVIALQMALKTDTALYPSGLVTGYFGTMTEAAVRAFQTRHALQVTGQVDAATHAKLIQVYGSAASGIGTNAPLQAPTGGGASGGGKG